VELAAEDGIASVVTPHDTQNQFITRTFPSPALLIEALDRLLQPPGD
jgi:hypothetical protein